MAEFPTILVLRRARVLGEDWTTATSWLGGLPRIGHQPWPRGRGGRALVFAAQIDLAELARASGPTDLPSSGSLAFFLGDDGRVLYVPPGEAGAALKPPIDASELTDAGGTYPDDLFGRRIFPRWPVEFRRLSVAAPARAFDDDDEDAFDRYHRQLATAASAFGEVDRSAADVRTLFEGADFDAWWRAVPQAFPDTILKGVHAGYHAEQVRRELPTRAMIESLSGPDGAFALLPGLVRDRINARLRLPIEGLHQIFGVGRDYNGYAQDEYHSGHLMLLQLGSDDLMHWSFGSCVQQFWIAPDALARRDWSAVRVVIDG